jgi:hypothetical protein
VGKAARAGIGRSDKNVSGFRIVQSIIETGNRARAVAKRRMRGDVLDALAVDIDLAAIAQAFKVLGAREGRAAPITSSGFCRCIGLSVRRPVRRFIRRTYCARGSPVRQSSLNGSSNFDEDQAHSS